MSFFIARVSSGVWLNPHHRCPLAECLCCRSDHGTATPLEGSERLLDDVKEVLNRKRVYAAGCIYNAMPVAQGEVAEITGLPPRLFRRPSCSRSWRQSVTATLFSRWWFLDAQRANRGRRLRPCSRVRSPASRWTRKYIPHALETDEQSQMVIDDLA